MKVLLLAGEASGDRMAASIARSLRAREPGVEIRAMGGEHLAREGVPLVVDSTPLAVVGIVEVLRVLAPLLKARTSLLAEMDSWRPDVVVPVDYPDFNLRIASAARARSIPVAWVVSPQVWAWRPGRVPAFARAVSRMLVLFPFEPAAWEAAGVPVEHVGHPILDQPALPSRADARRALGMDAGDLALAILPGSRRSEMARTWPVFAAAAARLAATRPELRVLVPLAPGLTAGDLRAADARPAVVSVHAGGMREVIAASDAAAVASGTATLETALVPCPLVAGYRVSRATMVLSRWLAEPGFLARGVFCLPNLVLGEAVVPEFYQEAFTPDRVASALAPLLDDEKARASARESLGRVREALGGLGGVGASARIADAVLDVARSRSRGA